MKAHHIEESSSRALHHFFEAEVMIEFSVTDEVQTPSLHLQKNVMAFPSQ